MRLALPVRRFGASAASCSSWHRRMSTDAARHVVIVGGGISGLAAAHALRKSAPRDRVRITVLESSPVVGGWLSTSTVDEFVFENGCRGIRPLGTGVAAMKLIEELGLVDEACIASDAARTRFLWHDNELQALPSSLVSLLRSRMLRDMRPWQLLRDLRLQPGDGRIDVSVHEFVQRHLGDYAADVLVDAVMSGIYAGDVRRLSAAATLKPLWQLECTHGSFIRAAVESMRASMNSSRSPNVEAADVPSPFVAAASRAASVSFQTGMQALPHALAAHLTANNVTVRTQAGVQRIAKTSSGRLKLACHDVSSGPFDLEADDIICSAPAHATANMLAGAAPDAAAALRALRTTNVAIACLGYRCDGLIKSPGFGYLVPSGDRSGAAEGLLGMIWDSAVFPGQRPAAHAHAAATPQTRVTLMFGGDTAPSMVASVDEQEWYERARTVLRVHMGINRTPDVRIISRAMQAIPQYDVGHLAQVRAIRAATLAAFGDDRVTLLGNSYDGIGVADCISNALAVGAGLAKRAVVGVRTSAP